MKIMAMMVMALFLSAAPIGGAIFLNIQEQEEEEVMIPNDTTPPTSTIDSPMYYLIPPLYGGIGTPGFIVTWEGTDNDGGVGIDNFDVQMRTFPSNCYGSYGIFPIFPYWHDLVTDTTETSTFVSVRHDMLYEFRVRAVDKNGNVESWSTFPQTRTMVVTIPNFIHEALVIGHKISDGVEERIRERVPEDTPPSSRVLPLKPLTLPEIIVTAIDEIVMYPDTKPMDPNLVPGDDILWFLNYNTIEMEWEGVDPNGEEELRFDVQYRRVYLDYPEVYTPESPIKPIIMPDATEWTDWLTDTTLKETSFPIDDPGLYEFRCRASDVQGNVEDYPLTADAVTYILPMI